MNNDIERWPSGSSGRSRAVGFGSLLWVVANALDSNADFRAQVAETLERLDSMLREGNSSRLRLLCVQVLLADMKTKQRFDEAWSLWIGDDPISWPQRSCIEVGLASGLLVEIVAVAARE